MNDRMQARQHIQTFGWNSTSSQILHEGIRHWWSLDGQVLVGYVISGHHAVVAGAPVCSPENLARGLAEWEAYCKLQRLTPLYFGAESRLCAELIGAPGYASVVLGSQPEWHPAELAANFLKVASLRAQVNRARNKGVTVREIASSDWRLGALQRKWQTSKALAPLQFLAASRPLSNLDGRRLFAAEVGKDLVGFLTLSPIPNRNGWLVEQMVRADHAVNGVLDLLLSESTQAIRSEGSTYLTLGIVPLIPPAGTNVSAWLRPLNAVARSQGSLLYNFCGLYEFKSKFRPSVWRPVTAIVRGTRFGPLHLRALVQAFTGVAPERMLLDHALSFLSAGKVLGGGVPGLTTVEAGAALTSSVSSLRDSPPPPLRSA